MKKKLRMFKSRCLLLKKLQKTIQTFSFSENTELVFMPSYRDQNLFDFKTREKRKLDKGWSFSGFFGANISISLLRVWGVYTLRLPR